MDFSTRSIRLLQNSINIGDLGSTANALVDYAQAQPVFKPFAVGAQAILSLPDTDKQRCALNDLVSSRLFSKTAKQCQASNLPALETVPAHFDRETAMVSLVECLPTWDAPVVQAIIRSIRIAGGLGHLALAFERIYASCSELEYREALGKLKVAEEQWMSSDTTDIYRSKLDRKEMKFLTRNGILEDQQSLLKCDPKINVDEIPFVVSLQAFVTKFDPVRNSLEQSGCFTDLLLQTKKVPWNRRGGGCVPMTLLTAHLAEMSHRQVTFLASARHTNLFDRKSGVVIDAGTSLDKGISTLCFWETIAGLKHGAETVPSEAVLCGLALSIWSQASLGVSDIGRRVVETALKVYPDCVNARIAQVDLTHDLAEKEKLLQESLRLSPLFFPALKRKFELLVRQRKFSEARRVAWYAVRTSWSRYDRAHKLIGANAEPFQPDLGDILYLSRMPATLSADQGNRRQERRDLRNAKKWERYFFFD